MTQGFRLTDKQVELRTQLAGPETHHLIYGGSRSGKTFLLMYAIAARAITAPGSRHVVFRKHGVAVKQSIGKDTFPKMMNMRYSNVPYKWHEQDGFFDIGDGSEIWLSGLDDKERVDKILGKEFATLYFNEASEIPLQSYMVAQTRLAQQVQKLDSMGGGLLPHKSYIDLNPTTRSHWTYRMFIDGINPDGEQELNVSDYAVGIANPLDNLSNLSADYIARLEAMPARQRQRFFSGEYTADVPNALWRREMFKRVKEMPGDLKRVVVAVDPAISNQVGSDETGVICAGIDAGGQGYLLADSSGKYKPEEWARKAVALYDQYDADRVIGEKNQGGDLVENVIRAHRPEISYEGVSATRGKFLRAEPIAALYERGRVFHVGRFDQLEDQMCSLTSDFDRKSQGISPDRVDALVWGFTSLFDSMVRKRVSSAPIIRQLGTMA